MSHKYRPPDSDLRPDPYSSDHTSLDQDLYRPLPSSFSPSFPSSSRDSAQRPQDGALSILSSCGLEPSDLSLLAELPEDILTVESLPYVLNQLKGKRGAVNAPSSSSSSSSHPPSSFTRDWDELRAQPVQYPLGLSSEKVQDHWGSPRTSSLVSAAPAVDVHHRSGHSATGSLSSRDRPSVRSAAPDRTRPPRLSESGSAGYRCAPPPEEHPPEPQSESSSTRSSRLAVAPPMPCKTEALDFHGKLPQVFPYSCSLCDITVLSERVWTKHVNSTCHADGQLRLLQRCPTWDCRVETLSGADNQSEKRKNAGTPTRPPQSANESQKPRGRGQSTQKASDKSKVVCVKFPAQSVDETDLRTLTEPFGKIVKILMFPSLAFVELGSVDQVKDLVKFHINHPPTVNGKQMEFSISNTFSFLQSSRVVSFSPAPTGEDGRSDLISIVKRFGRPLYTLFLPSAAFVEMENVPDAQKLLDYYSAKTLRINRDLVKVSLSGDYRSLMRVASATKYEDEAPSAQRARSREQEDETDNKRSRSTDESRAKRSRSRSRSTDESRAKRSRSRSRSTDESRAKRSRSRDESRAKRSRSRSRSRDESRAKRSRSRSTDETSSRSSAQNASREETVEPEKDSEAEPADDRQSEEEESSADESDIEGMEVIGEDVDDEDLETSEEEEEEDEGDRNDTTEKGNVEEEEEVKEEESTREREGSEDIQLDDEEGPGFPVDLENCITLDQLEDEQSDTEKSESQSSRKGDRLSRSRTSDRDEACRRESGSRTTPETPETECVSGQTPEIKLFPKTGQEDKMLKEKVTRDESQTKEEVTETDAPEDEPEKSPDRPQTEQKYDAAVKLEQPVGGVTEPEKPTKPVGTAFVRPVVGYFCGLCQVIYADEDEAKLQHCSSLTHYRRYQEKTGIDPWTS